MNINFELYKVFYHVAKELSFTGAAKTLFLTQSAVSQSINTLEKELNIKLFNRSTKKVMLTTEGETLFKYIEPAILSINQGERQLSALTNLEHGKLHIGASDTICKYYLLPYLKTFHKRYPGIEVLITNRTSIQCVSLLKTGEVDMIITNLPNNELDSSYNIIETKTFKDIVIAPSTYTALLNKPTTLLGLTKYPVLLLDKESSTTRYLQELFTKEHLTLKPAIELGSIDLLVDMTKIGLGLTFIPDFMYKEDTSIIKVALKKELRMRKLAIVTQSKAPVSVATKAFISLISEEPRS